MINKWASWCDPCRAEFPVFQQVATERGKQVAFLGLNGGDSTRPARSDSSPSSPCPYPSYVDPDEEIARAIKARDELPHHRVRRTRTARTTFIHQGAYRAGGRARGGHRPLRGRMTRPRSAVDPLTGLKVIIATGARRPSRRRLRRPAAPADRPGAATRSCPATRTGRRPSCTRVRPAAAAGQPGWQVRVVPNLYPAARRRRERAAGRRGARPLHRARPPPARTR